jgi:hypothetical protein
MTRTPTIRVRLALAFQGACVSTIAIYGVLRVVQALFLDPPNPVVALPGAHAAYFWRLWTAEYAGAMLGFLVFAATKNHDTEVCRALVWALYVAGAVILTQGLLVP